MHALNRRHLGSRYIEVYVSSEEAMIVADRSWLKVAPISVSAAPRGPT